MQCITKIPFISIKITVNKRVMFWECSRHGIIKTRVVFHFFLTHWHELTSVCPSVLTILYELTSVCPSVLTFSHKLSSVCLNTLTYSHKLTSVCPSVLTYLSSAGFRTTKCYYHVIRKTPKSKPHDTKTISSSLLDHQKLKSGSQEL